MDDIYGDLDNYNEQHIISELKGENKELKCKLDKYATTLDALQKEFDKLSSEYKKLELNYSSLLKTAKAEIDRKTKIITDLNKEKDMLIINSLQSRGKRPPNILHTQVVCKENTKQVEKKFPRKPSSEKEIVDLSVQKPADCNKASLLERNNAQSKTPSSTSLSCSTGYQTSNREQEPQKTYQENNQVNDLMRTESKERKTEVSLNEQQRPTSSVKRIMNRRKSMPAMNRPNVIYSSEEEQDSSNQRDDHITKNTNDDINRQGTYDFRDRKNTDQKNEYSNFRYERGRKKTDGKYDYGHTRDGWGRKNSDQKQEFSYPKDQGRRNLDPKLETTYPRDEWGRQNTEKGHQFADTRDYQGRKKMEAKYNLSNPADDWSSRKSDDRYDSNYLKYGRGRKNTPFKDPVDRRHDWDQRNCDRNGSKVSNISSTDNKRFSYHDSRDVYHHSGSSRYYDSDKNKRGSDLRAKSNHSPGKHFYQHHNDFSGDQASRSNYVPHRVLESPPPDAYTQTRRNLNGERQRFHDQEKYAIKQKLQTHVEEPPQKRIRRDSQNRHSNETGIVQHEQDVKTHTVPVLVPPSEYHDFSCQSPDYEFNPSLYPVKEIMYTAATQLEDPRLKSKKYILGKEDNKDILSTINGRNVDLKFVNKCAWGIPQQKIPTPLKEKPLNESDEFVKEIYMQIDNPISNLSLESGEIHWSEDNRVRLNTKPIEIHRNERKIEHKQQNEMDSKVTPKIDPPSKHLKTQSEINSRHQKFSKDTLEIHNITDVYSEDTHKETNTSIATSNEGTFDQRVDRDNNLSQMMPIDPFIQSSDGNVICKNNKINEDKDKVRRETHLIVKLPLLLKDTVEGDLELSDETSDCMDIPDHPRDIEHKEGREREKHTENLDLIKKGITNDKKEIINVDEFQNIKQVSSHHQHGVSSVDGNKKYPEFSEEIPSNKNERNKTISEADVTKPKISSMTKNKFCDLFGDSSSLITPDDLGLTNKNQQTILKDYDPLFESTQDAVDFNLKEITKVKTRISKIKTNEAEMKSKPKDGKQDKKYKNEDKIGAKTENKKKSSITSSRGLNEKISSEEPNLVKTVIISSGLQNNCPFTNNSCKEPKSSTPAIQNSDNAGTSQALSRMTALATSTPYKIPGPEISSNVTANSDTMPPISNNVSSAGDVGHREPNNIDIPDMRIFIKRRRKTRASLTTHS